MQTIVLASGSPRRRELLSEYNINLKIIESNIDEKVLENEKPHHVAMALAFEKAQDVAGKLKDNEIVIGADTIVCKGIILGKPRNKEEAFNMLSSLNGKEHSVFTGISIIKTGTNVKIIDFEETKVIFRNLTEEKIRKYLETDEYKDKAGSYAIQGLGSLLVDSITGSYSNVVGLPIAKLDYLLEKHFGVNLL